MPAAPAPPREESLRLPLVEEAPVRLPREGFVELDDLRLDKRLLTSNLPLGYRVDVLEAIEVTKDQKFSVISSY